MCMIKVSFIISNLAIASGYFCYYLLLNSMWEIEPCKILISVTKVKLATSAVKIISSGKKHFDVVMADIQTPDTNIIQRLLEESLQKDMLVICEYSSSLLMATS